ncbi:MAG: 6-phosphofructokinase [Hyphomicrobiales bacterium]
MSDKKKRIGILTAGGDCPGLNAAIRGVGKTAIIDHGMEVIGINSGFLGLINKEYIPLTEENLSGIITLGGTILGTSREKPYKKKRNGVLVVDKPKLIVDHYKEMNFDCLVVIGGNGTMSTAHRLSEEGLNIIGIPKTIDNDVWGTDNTFGFDSALSIATEAIDRLHTTANSHRRTMVIEIMGHHAGWLTLYSGMASGGDVILIPEIPYNMKKVAKCLEERVKNGKPFSIVVVAEGIKHPKKAHAANYIAQQIQELTGLETRETILGYIQRGGSPTATDRILATRFGTYAADLIVNENYGQMVIEDQGAIHHRPLSEIGGKTRLVPTDHELIQQLRKMGACFGD